MFVLCVCADCILCIQGDEKTRAGEEIECYLLVCATPKSVIPMPKPQCHGATWEFAPLTEQTKKIPVMLVAKKRNKVPIDRLLLFLFFDFE